jgi:S1-C subfamily serine protease
VLQSVPQRRDRDFLGDVLLSARGEPVENVQTLQRLMLGPAIGSRLPLTLLRRGALVDVVAVPEELRRG